MKCDYCNATAEVENNTIPKGWFACRIRKAAGVYVIGPTLCPDHKAQFEDIFKKTTPKSEWFKRAVKIQMDLTGLVTEMALEHRDDLTPSITALTRASDAIDNGMDRIKDLPV